ncbi:unnamed protein product [Diamesa serratosioi]
MAELFAKYTCTNCQDLINGVRVHCTQCSSDVELCLQCFSAGAEMGPHKNNHSYQFMDPGAITIFRGKGSWSALEELRLLNAVEQFGFGNWEDISKHIETRSPEDAKEEYIHKFLNGTIGKHTWSDTHRPTLIDHTADDDRTVNELQLERLNDTPLDITSEEAAQLGYMPNRDDFEREYDPTAEQLVSNLALTSEDDEVEVALKLAQVDLYTRRLRERARRKRLVRDFKLISDFFRGNIKRASQTRDEREFRQRLRTFAQFYSTDDYERLITSLERERILRVRLTELFRYRWNGLTKIDDCDHFERHAAANQHKTTGPFGHGKTVIVGSYVNCILNLIINRKGERETSSSSIGQKSMHHTGVRASSVALWPNKSSLDSTQNQGSQLAQQSIQQPVDPMKLGADLLTFNEKQLCSSYNLPPTRFFTIKTVLLSGGAQPTNDSAEKQIKKYLVKSGWMKNDA